MLLIKNIEIYAPEAKGVQDVLIAGEKIEWMDRNIEINQEKCQVIDGTDKILVPGFIDGHVHLIGGGGEGGFRTRAPNISLEGLIRIGSDTRIAGMISGKPGFVVLHMGDDKRGLQPVFEALEKTSIPTKIFRPTHVNRNLDLLKQGMQYLKMGGYVDYTCGMDDDMTPGQCILKVKEAGIPTEHITISSDGHGSWSHYDSEGNLTEIGVSSLGSLYNEFKDMVQNLGIPMEKALTFVTSNVAKAFEVYPKKGCICEGSDADLLIMDKNLNLDTVIARGKVMMENSRVLIKGSFN